MTTLPERNAVHYDEPETKAPPLLAVGPLAWIRKNLFGSLTDTVLTIVGAVVLTSVLTGFLTWAVTWGNWFVINFNLRQFLVGRFDPAAEWRIALLVLIIAFILGWALAAWSRISQQVLALLLVIAAVTVIVPPVIRATITVSPSIITAGADQIVSGSVTRSALPQVGFIGAAGETVRIQMASGFGQRDEELVSLFGFADEPANILRGAAENRLRAESRIPEIEQRLLGDGLTPNQRAALTTELERLEVPPSITETYTINENAVAVSILDGSTLEPLASASLLPGSEPLVFVLPADGWYVLDKRIDGPGLALLAANNVEPLLERTFTRSASVSATGERTEAQRVSQFIRMRDGFLVEGGRPRVEGEDLPYMGIIENQYRGARPFHDYLALFLGPFLGLLRNGLLLILLAGTLGYLLSRASDRVPFIRSPRRVAFWMLIALPPVALILIAGVGILPSTSPPLWGGLLLTLMLTVVGIVGAFPIGILLALGRRSHLPVVKGFCILYIELVRGVPLITVLVMSMVVVPLVAPWLGGPDTAPYRAMVAVTLFSAAYLAENVRGGLQSLPPGQEEAAKALGLPAWQVTLNITLPQALRAVIPALVGQFIALFKDTSLVAIIGLIDLTGIAQAVVAQTEFIGLRREVFVFISIIYFVFSYVMSIISRRIEASGSGAARRV